VHELACHRSFIACQHRHAFPLPPFSPTSRQVHGHDFNCAAAFDDPQAPQHHLYASGSEEKVIRVFQASQAFAQTLAMARGGAPPPARPGGAGAEMALGAVLPALGLSNKAVYGDEVEGEWEGEGGSSSGGLVGVPGYSDGPDFAPSAAPSAVAGAPLEEHLAQNTLWPEVRKLYGHGNEVYCMDTDPRGCFLASACRAQSPAAAAIWLWDMRTWTGAARLEGHALTVTRLAFSPDGALLASCSRDRSVCVFGRGEGPGEGRAGELGSGLGLGLGLGWLPAVPCSFPPVSLLDF
jgi:elongator complex protein 2